MTRNVSRGLVLTVLALVLTCCGSGDPATESAPTPQPTSIAPHPTSVVPREPRHRATTSPAPAPVPSRLDIAAIGLSTSLGALGLNEDGTVEVPKDPALAGWFNLGTVPGRRGSAVILGHVDSPAGPAVFADLATLSVGDDIEVGLSNGTVVTFEVQEVATFANADFPAQRVYADTTGRSALNLVTCGGEYDRDRGGYQSNVIVFSERVPT